MEEKRIAPTDPARESALGRVAVWLDVADLLWLSQHCGCPQDATEEQRARCARVRFRAAAALRKASHNRD